MKSEQEIQDYLDGKLSGEELKQFESALLNDEELAIEVATLRETEEGLRAVAYDTFKREVRQWEQQYQFKRRRTFHLYLAIAASVVLVIVASIVYLRDDTTQSDQLYAAYFEPYDDMILTRGAEIPQELVRGMEAYNQKNYDEAVVLLQQYVNAYPSGERIPFLYLAISQMVTGDYRSAEMNFDEAKKDDRLSQQAEWYLALMQLKRNYLDEAKALLTKISNSTQHYKKREARQLLDKIN